MTNKDMVKLNSDYRRICCIPLRSLISLTNGILKFTTKGCRSLPANGSQLEIQTHALLLIHHQNPIRFHCTGNLSQSQPSIPSRHFLPPSLLLPLRPCEFIKLAFRSDQNPPWMVDVEEGESNQHRYGVESVEEDFVPGERRGITIRVFCETVDDSDLDEVVRRLSN